MIRIILLFIFLFSISLLANESFTILDPNTKITTYLLNPSALSQSAKDKSSISVHLDATHQARFSYKKMTIRTEGEDYSWLGVDANNPQDRLRATYKSGVFYVYFTYEGFRYTIESHDGHYFLSKLSQDSAQTRENDAIELPSSSPSALLRGADIAAASAAIDETAEININILVYYTKNFETTYGAGVDAFIQGMFDDANEALNNSLTKTTLVNVHTELLDTLYTSESYTIDTALTQLSGASLDMQVKRSLYGANLVSLLRVYNSAGQACGLAYVPASIDTRKDINALYSVVEVGSAGGYYCPDLTFAHEVGHNLGCAHNRAEGGAGLYEYSHGYDISGTFATVMSYETPGIAYFSNPDLNDISSGLPIGIAEGNPNSADCSKTIRRSKLAISSNTRVDEPLESGDIQSDYHIEGSLFEDADRDSYRVRLSGVTQFNGSNPKYLNWAYFLNLYDENNHLVGTYSDDFTLDLSSGFYTIIFSDSSDEAEGFFSDTPTNYTMDITTTELSAPIISVITSQSTNEDTNLSIAYDINSLENLDLVFDKNTTHGALSFNSTHITYVPDANYFGTDSFVISVTDSNADSDSAEVNITVVGVNDDPSLEIVGSLTTDEDSSASLSFTLSDVEDSALSLSVETQAEHGSVNIISNSVLYTPVANYNGADSFELSVTDSSGKKIIKHIDVSVASVNDVPMVSVLESFETAFNTLKVFSFDAQDSDNDTILVSLNSSALHGEVSINTNSITYTPQADYSGEDSFVLLFSDAKGGNVNKTIAITVLAPENNTTTTSTTTTPPEEPSCQDESTIINTSEIFYNSCQYSLANNTLSSSTLSVETTVTNDSELKIISRYEDREINFSSNMSGASLHLKEAGEWTFSVTKLFANAPAIELLYEVSNSLTTSISQVINGTGQSIYHLRASDNSALETQEVNYKELSDGSVDIETIVNLPSSGLVIE